MSSRYRKFLSAMTVKESQDSLTSQVSPPARDFVSTMSTSNPLPLVSSQQERLSTLSRNSTLPPLPDHSSLAEKNEHLLEDQQSRQRIMGRPSLDRPSFKIYPEPSVDHSHSSTRIPQDKHIRLQVHIGYSHFF